MITLTRLDGRELVVNADHILTAEPTPDTVLLLSTGLKLMVREAIPEVLDRVAAWKRRIGVCVLHPRVIEPHPPDPEREGPDHIATDHAAATERTATDHSATVLSFPRGVPSED